MIAARLRGSEISVNPEILGIEPNALRNDTIAGIDDKLQNSRASPNGTPVTKTIQYDRVDGNVKINGGTNRCMVAILRIDLRYTSPSSELHAKYITGGHKSKSIRVVIPT